jgi:uncharacterized protein
MLLSRTDLQAVRRDRLDEAIGHASHVLPAQGPITVFIHHNTLHAFEDLPFHEAVKKGAQIFGCQPYLSEVDTVKHWRAGESGSQSFRK